MTQVAIQNYIGRDYSISFVTGNAIDVKNVVLKKGLNIVDGEAWDQIKNHPSVKILQETNHDYCVERIKLLDGNEDDKNYITQKRTYNISDGKTHKKLEVIDYRKTIEPIKSEPASICEESSTPKRGRPKLNPED